MQNLDNLCMGCMNDNGGEEVCPICGFDSLSPTPPNALSLKTLLNNRYLVGKILTTGGEGITYLGYDTELSKPVRIKEYYPNDICARKDGKSVKVKKDSTFIYNSGIMEFLELSKNLQDIGSLPGIYEVLDCFEENGTAYRVTDYSNGITLMEFLLRNGGTLTWEQAKSLFVPLIPTILKLHASGIIHMGISPETIFVGRDGRLRLTEFSIAAVRTADSDLPAQLFAGYAAIEQYGYEDTKISTATDVYSFAATLFRTLIGNPPPAANLRINNDNMSFPQKLASEIPQNVLIALANALQILPEDRTRNFTELKQDLDDSEYVAEKEQKREKEEIKKEKKANKSVTIKAAVITAAALILIALILVFTVFRASIFGNTKETSSMLNLSSLESVGPVSNTVSHSEKLYAVPDFTGKTFAEVSTNVDYANTFKMSVAKKEFSNTFDKGTIMAQSVQKNSNVAKNTEITFTVSLGPKSFKLPTSLKGMSRKDAYIKLLEMGIEPSAIKFYSKMGSTATKEEVVLETSPSLGSTITPDTQINVFYNSNIITYNNNSSSEDTDVSSEEYSTIE